MTSPYSAEYGRSPGAAISVTTKSGTNEFHGTALRLLPQRALRLEQLLQRGFRSERGQPAAKPANDQNQFGAQPGRARSSRTRRSSSSTTRARASRAASPASPACPPLDERRGHLHGRRARSAHRPAVPGQHASRRTASIPWRPAILALLPRPNQPGANNYFRQTPRSIDNADRFLGRVDLRARPATTTSSRATSTPTATACIPGWFGGIVDGTGTSAFGDQDDEVATAWSAGWTRIFSPSMVNEFRFSWSAGRLRRGAGAFGQDAAGGGAACPACPTDPLFGGGLTGMHDRRLLRRPGLGRIGSPNFLPKFQHTNQFEFLNTLSWLKGNHAFKFGVDVMAPMKNEYMDVPGDARRAALPQPLHRATRWATSCSATSPTRCSRTSTWSTSATGRRRSSSRTTGR